MSYVIAACKYRDSPVLCMRRHIDILHDDYAGLFVTIEQTHDLENGLNMVTNILLHIVLNREHKVILAVELVLALWGHAIFVKTSCPENCIQVLSFVTILDICLPEAYT